MTHDEELLVIGGTGTVGSRLVAQLRDRGLPIRPATRHTDPPFHWADRSTWDAALAGARRMYLLLPDDTPLADGFLEHAAKTGVRRVVLHSDRGVDAMGVGRLQDAEAQVRRWPFEWSIVRPDWFDQNFETFFRDAVLAGRLCVPVGETLQGFIDAADIAAVAVTALTTDDLLGQVLELTGPAALSFREAVDVIGGATAAAIEFDGTPDAYRQAMAEAGLPQEAIDGLLKSFAALAARGDTVPTGVVEAVLERPARPFADYVADAAACGVWRQSRT